MSPARAHFRVKRTSSIPFACTLTRWVDGPGFFFQSATVCRFLAFVSINRWSIHHISPLIFFNLFPVIFFWRKLFSIFLSSSWPTNSFQPGLENFNGPWAASPHTFSQPSGPTTPWVGTGHHALLCVENYVTTDYWIRSLPSHQH